MAVPKRQHTKARTGKRRFNASKAFRLQDLIKCFNCGKLKENHVACPNCGSYKKAAK